MILFSVSLTRFLKVGDMLYCDLALFYGKKIHFFVRFVCCHIQIFFV